MNKSRSPKRVKKLLNYLEKRHAYELPWAAASPSIKIKNKSEYPEDEANFADAYPRRYKTSLQNVPLNKILYTQDSVDLAKLRKYSKELRGVNKDKFPPVRLIKTNSDHYEIIDGHHRVITTKLLSDQKTIPAVVHEIKPFYKTTRRALPVFWNPDRAANKAYSLGKTTLDNQLPWYKGPPRSELGESWGEAWKLHWRGEKKRGNVFANKWLRRGAGMGVGALHGTNLGMLAHHIATGNKPAAIVHGIVGAMGTGFMGPMLDGHIRDTANIRKKLNNIKQKKLQESWKEAWKTHWRIEKSRGNPFAKKRLRWPITGLLGTQVGMGLGSIATGIATKNSESVISGAGNLLAASPWAFALGTHFKDIKRIRQKIKEKKPLDDF